MATRFWVGGGSSANWSAITPTNWSATSGGANNASVPGASDDVTFDGAGTGNSNSTISASVTILSLNITSGYTATMTHNIGTVLTIAGNWTRGANYTIAGAGSITISAASTITSNGKTWPNAVTFSGANTKTLADASVFTGNLIILGATVLNGFTLQVGGLAMSLALSGTTVLTISGGTWSGVQALSLNTNLAGNVTISGTVTYHTGTLSYVSGTITTTGSTLVTSLATTFNTAGMTWNNINIASISGNITINSLLSITGTFTLPTTNSMSFLGTAGWTAATATSASISATVITFKNGNTYTVTNALNWFGGRIGAAPTFTSDHATLRAILTLQQGATNNLLMNFTRIDASAGRTIRTFNGVVTDSPNVQSFSDLLTTSSQF